MSIASVQPAPGKFSLGRIVATPGALQAIGREDMLAALLRHSAGDWGDMDEHDCRANEEALRTGARLLSAYQRDGIRFWIITEATTDSDSREYTTILLPSEY